MTKIHVFTFNPFEENTYILSDETNDCAIIDPGCYDDLEKEELSSYIEKEKLNPVKLLMTHAHIDHMLGNNFVSSKYNLKIEMHESEIPLLQAAHVYGEMWGIQADPSPMPEILLTEGDTVKFGNTELKVLFTPGHSIGSITFYNAKENYAIAGDVLFHQSIGRTDLPGGDFDTLINSIREKLFSLSDDCRIYPGHGPSTTIGFEKKHNPFLI